jgi:hypothetical protein
MLAVAVTDRASWLRMRERRISNSTARNSAVGSKRVMRSFLCKGMQRAVQCGIVWSCSILVTLATDLSSCELREATLQLTDSVSLLTDK